MLAYLWLHGFKWVRLSLVGAISGCSGKDVKPESGTPFGKDVKFAWATAIGGEGSDRGYSVVTDKAGSIFVTGEFRGSIDFDPGEGVTEYTSDPNGNIFIQKLKQDGNYFWTKAFAGTRSGTATKIAVDKLGNVIVTGSIIGTVNPDPGSDGSTFSSNGGSDIFVLKLDSDGKVLWAKTMGGASGDIAYRVAVDSWIQSTLIQVLERRVLHHRVSTTSTYRSLTQTGSSYGSRGWEVNETKGRMQLQWTTRVMSIPLGYSVERLILTLAQGFTTSPNQWIRLVSC